ncbi:hypothetical protein LEP1GSC115_2611 [Leptospira interrogans serovar Australis str. 200703203]|uniref:Uncharacterized protein n=1 Tax=Leptospira interrogans serovar Australis str. 200703203 TaxID=1085541 RepID=N1UYN3_LEPIR|nr:hypothetical protein LEP1GSC115_2611 [Leptospira interrogans serovar Australis str. 200703203]
MFSSQEGFKSSETTFFFQKNKILLSLADLLEKRKAEILLANELDLKDGKEKKLSSALMDRLLLERKKNFFYGFCGS